MTAITKPPMTQQKGLLKSCCHYDHRTIMVLVMLVLLSSSTGTMTWAKNNNNNNNNNNNSHNKKSSSSWSTRQASYNAPAEDPYRVLGVTNRRRASMDDIKKAYREQAKAHHPDKNPHNASAAADQFRRIVAAWEFLSDPGNKRTYDLFLQQTTSSSSTSSKQKMFTQQQQKARTNRNKEHSHYTFTQTSYGSHTQKNQKTQKQQSHQKQQQSPKRAQIIKDAKYAQEHQVRHISTLEQFKEDLLDRQGRFKQHFLGVFVAGKKMEHFVNEELLFPYPFVVVNHNDKQDNDIPWNTLLYTVKMRYNSHETPLTKAFGVPSPQQVAYNKPYIVFCKQGATMQQIKTFSLPTPRSSLPKNIQQEPYEWLREWVLKQLVVHVTVVNHHQQDSIQIYLLSSSSTSTKPRLVGQPVPPNHQVTLRVHVADRIVILNAHTDQFFLHGTTNTNNNNNAFNAELLQRPEILEAVLMDKVVVRHTDQRIDIGRPYIHNDWFDWLDFTTTATTTTRTCYDRSLHCYDWARQTKPQQQRRSTTKSSSTASNNNCEEHWEFGHVMCPHSCGVCSDTVLSPTWNALHYGIFYYPLYKVPTPLLRGMLHALRATAQFGSVFAHDLSHVWSLRRNVMVAFVLAGLVLGIQLVVLADTLLVLEQHHHQHSQQQRRSRTSTSTTMSWLSLWDNAALLLLLTISMLAWAIWMVQASPSEVPIMLRGFQKDLHHMVLHSMDALYSLLYIGFISLVLSKKLSQRTFSRLTLRQQNTTNNGGSFHFLLYSLLSLVWVSTAILLGATFMIQNDIIVDGTRNHRSIRWTNIWKLRKNVALSVLSLGILLGATVLALGRFLWQSKRLLVVTLANVCFVLGGTILASEDRYFFKDLDHVLQMRMSAAVPCMIVGMVTGMSLTHILSSYQVKVKVD